MAQAAALALNNVEEVNMEQHRRSENESLNNSSDYLLLLLSWQIVYRDEPKHVLRNSGCCTDFDSVILTKSLFLPFPAQLSSKRL